MENATLERPGTPDKLNITLALDEATRAKFAQTSLVVQVAEAFVIDSTDMANAAKTDLDSIVAQKARIEAGRKGFIAPAMAIIENAKAWFNPPLLALQQAEDIMRKKLVAWTTSERLRVEAENKAREEAARRARQEAEQKAAAERAKAEEREREARERAAAEEKKRAAAAAEAEAARQAGDKKAAAEAEAKARAAAAEKARQDERERLAREEGERKAREAQLAADAAAKAAPKPAEAAGVAGFSTRSVWVAELAPEKTEDDAKLEIAKAIAAGRTDFLPLFKLDMGAASKLAKAQKGHFNVPCLKAVEETGSMNRSKKS